GGEFITDEESEPSINPAILQKIKTSYKRTSLKNYFSPSVCDIEQDIYRLDFDGRDELTRALWHEDHVLPKDIRSKDARILYLRYLLREQWDDAKSWNLFEKYAHYRYGGKILMKKSGSETENENHLSFSELETELLQSLENAENKEDQKLLHSLKAFYEQSPVARAFANS
ncbi:MAG: hypothetical protein KDD62_15840, partial [Bdellovibrionales bacterium]|nr:hypothetical protein [Bdellovibrionales bacterium]